MPELAQTQLGLVHLERKDRSMDQLEPPQDIDSTLRHDQLVIDRDAKIIVPGMPNDLEPNKSG